MFFVGFRFFYAHHVNVFLYSDYPFLTFVVLESVSVHLAVGAFVESQTGVHVAVGMVFPHQRPVTGSVEHDTIFPVVVNLYFEGVCLGQRRLQVEIYIWGGRLEATGCFLFDVLSVNLLRAFMREAVRSTRVNPVRTSPW